MTEKSGHDVTFQLKSGNQITAHRSFLASRSKFFEKLFETHQNTYPLEGLQDDTLQFYINFLYTGYPQISILPKPIDSKLIQILQVDQNNSLRNYITGEAVYITDIYLITRSIDDDIRKLYNLAIQSKNQSKKAINNSSLICIQLMEENTKTDCFFVDKTFMRRIDFFRNILDSGMSEAETGVITLEISSECCEKLIEFMYIGQISNISDSALLELFIISKQYLHCQELVHYCENNLSRIIQNLTPQVAVHIIDYFRDTCHAVDDLISRCRYYICTNFDNSREDILNLDSDSRYELSRLYFDYLKRKFKRK
ncbi:hypothetical protein NAEGRDRAFT_78532 [Naegleria gruberi]|uniref:BTB domain-containing protein n=1 Tax=Naegleria gruberi TaxID=5762 RepID=D2V4F5_NAEGR|nr:uncharacterized protein NAEGRDRAFT_78532 [Naegleria gruberi]EFC48377.1 hypothetical protein NAEGRDRAFT_78532 [Naegleria gruberi]|eukprot:XP_002681121.1 hypothetical protein NAEGRDRAFT_78532 [Naegleria gruberi strain NEG-M]